MRLKKEHEQLLRQYIETPSITTQDNGGVVRFLDSCFRQKGWETAVIESDKFPGLKNFTARLEPAGNSRAADLVITAHLDTVAPQAEDWDNNAPFKLDYRNGVYIGNGVTDTKGPTVTAIIAALETCTSESLKRPLSFWFDHSEENRLEGLPLKGSYEMIQWFESSEMAVDAMIIIEPTNLFPINSHNGYAEVVIETKGRAAHSSVPEKGVNAIEAMAEVVMKLKTLAGQLRKDYDFPMNVGFIEGGRKNQINVVAEKCKIILDFRCPPKSISGDQVYDKITEMLQDTGAQSQFRFEPIPPFHCEPDREIIKIVSQASSNPPQHVSYYSDAAAYRNLLDKGQLKDGICVFGCGDIKHAHAANEHITEDELIKGIECFKKIIHTYCMD